jgi:hypothetical protein
LKEQPSFKYWPLYCEENIWHLCQHPFFADHQKRVVFISNQSKSCIVCCQKSATTAIAPIIWDYHVVLFAKERSQDAIEQPTQGQWQVWDLDSTLPLGSCAEQYLSKTLPKLRQGFDHFEPRFVTFDGDKFVQFFSSDRSHMLDGNGNWIAPHPLWNVIESDVNLSQSNCSLTTILSKEQSWDLQLYQLTQDNFALFDDPHCS